VREGVEGLLAVATGPARLRAGLRRATRPIRRSRRATGGIGRLRTTFPAAVFGGDLLGILGERLRALLAPPPPDAEERTALASAWRRAAARAGDGTARSVQAARDASAPPGQARRPAGARPSPARAGLELDDDRARGVASPRAARRAVERAEDGAPLAGAALLDDRLRRYWVTVHAEAQRAASASRAAQPGAGARPGRGGATESAAALPLGGLSEVEIAQELRAFVSDTPLVRPETAAPATGNGDEGVEALWLERAGEGTRSGRLPRGRDLPPPAHVLRHAGLDARERTALLRELADQMAAVVREQAVRHGIDLP
jgi:hypothetical protein